MTKTRSSAQILIKLIVDFRDMPLRERDGYVLASSQWSSRERYVRAGFLFDDGVHDLSGSRVKSKLAISSIFRGEITTPQTYISG
jgi:hypothetical protein